APDTGLGAGAGNYNTSALDNGALHFVGGPRLGAAVDTEYPAAANVGATGDGADDDGVTFLSTLVAAATNSSASVSADLQNAAGARLDGFIDFNQAGDWSDAGEQIIASAPLTAGANIVSFVIPGGATVGSTYARFRVSTAGGLVAVGQAADGEVEDY